MTKYRSEAASVQNERFYQMCRVPYSCIQLAQVAATLAQQPGSRPIPDPTWCVARDWPRPGAILAWLRSDPGARRASQCQQRPTPTPFNMERAFGTPLTTLSCAKLLFSLNPEYFKKFCSCQVEMFFTADKKVPLERGVWAKVGMALKPEVKHLERGTS